MNFSIDELTRSDTALRLGIDNTPDENVKANLKRLILDVLQPLRDELKEPIIVNSGYRSPELNKAVGGAKTSQHLTGEAADIRAIPHPGESQKMANERLFNFISTRIKFGFVNVGQLLDEKNFSWIHVSLPSAKHKNDIRHL